MTAEPVVLVLVLVLVAWHGSWVWDRVVPLLEARGLVVLTPVCTEDRAISPDVQRDVFAPRADDVVELEASHSSLFSQPAAVADLLAARTA